MKKEEILSKLHGKNYNNELEKVLETKDFSEEVKNLLLSMLYKIELSYSDYETIKVNVENKSQYLDRVIEIIRQCNSIEIILPKSEKDYELAAQKKIQFVKDSLTKEIITFPNERIMLYALNELDNVNIYLDEKYSLIRVGFAQLINEGRNINNVEVIRDFNAWSWNIQVNEISNLQYNLIYQNLQILLGFNNLNNWLFSKNKDYIVTLEEMIQKIYGKKNSELLIKLLSKLSIILCISNNEKERIRILSEKKLLESELDKINNISELTLEVFEKKKEILKKIRHIDTLLNDKSLLTNEYIKRNEKLPEYHKIFSLSHLTDILITDRKKLIKKLEEYNNLVEPSNYVKTKRKYTNNLELLDGIQLEYSDNTDFYTYLIQLEIVFLNCFQLKVRKANTKKEIMDLVYMYRYYGELPFSVKQKIRQVYQLNEKLTQTEELLLEKMYEIKTINRFSNDISLNNLILQKILESKIVKLENISVEIRVQLDTINIIIFDGDILEENYEVNNTYEIKTSKKMKMFI